MLGVPTSSSSTRSRPLWKCTRLGREPVYSCWANGWEEASAMGSDPLRAASVTRKTWRGDNYPAEKGVMTRPCHSFTVHPAQRKQRKKGLFSPRLLQKDKLLSMKQIPLFFPGTVRSWAPKVLQYKGLGWNTARFLAYTHTLTLFWFSSSWD